MHDSTQHTSSRNIPTAAYSGEQAAPPARGAQRPAGRGGAAAPRLDKRTYLDKEQGRYSVVLRDYGGGLCEVGWSFVPNLQSFKAGRGESEQRKAHEDRAVRRARSRLRQLILAAHADHLLTLTYRENVSDYKQASQDLSGFIRHVRTYLTGFIFIAVPERQKRGAWHWHLAVVGRQDVALLRGLWRSVVGEGNIDVKPPKRGVNRRLAIVRYLGKYLAKGFADGERELNGHRYRASLGIQVPGEFVQIPEHLRGEVSAYVLALLQKRSGNVGFAWVDPAYQAGWACSWG
ncbi:MAG: hypothetical protein HYY97_11810 [Rhodocyclales bacterium]|nr:hypothetical protein [Rhodocyclales bacterium]